MHNQEICEESTQNHEVVDSGLISLILLARFHGLPVESDQLIHEFRQPGNYLALPKLCWQLKN